MVSAARGYAASLALPDLPSVLYQPSERFGEKPQLLVYSLEDARLAYQVTDPRINRYELLSLKEDEHPIIHSDRGSHYRWPGWIERMDKYHLTRSMSQKGCSPDNSACEGFFGVIKNAIFYGRDWKGITIDEFNSFLNDYLHWFREKRIKQKLGFKSPIQYRASIGIPFHQNIALNC